MSTIQCEGWVRHGGAFTLGPVTWKQCTNDASIMLTVVQDGKEETFPACADCHNEAIVRGIQILKFEKIFFTLQESGLHGSEIINRLQRGHVVRRACWIEHVYVRICNERGFDENGLAVFDEKNDHLYTLGTNGYFIHLGLSGQPFKEKKVYQRPGYKGVEFSGRDGEGMNYFFANDWEDYGFCPSERFYEARKELRPLVEEREAYWKQVALDKYNAEHSNESFSTT